MNLVQILPFAIFGVISVVAYLLVSMFNKKEDRAAERLEDIKDPTRRRKDHASGEGVQGMFQKAAPQLSRALKPKTELEENALKIRLANAGFNNPNAPTFYLASKVVSLAVGAIAGGAIGIPLWGASQSGLTALVVGAGFGLYIPEVTLWWWRRSRQSKIFLSMPDALDLLVVCVESGLGLDQGMRRVTEELEDTHPEICSEFNMCNFQQQMGRPRREVLHDLGVRTGVDDMRALAAILIQAEKFGSSIAQALRVQSDSMRVKRMQMAEEKAQQTAVKMIFPLVLFIFPGIFVVLVGPAAIMMIDGLFTV